MTGKDTTDAALDYAYAAGKLAAKFEAYNRDVEEFLAEYDINPTPHRYMSDDVEEGKVSPKADLVAAIT